MVRDGSMLELLAHSELETLSKVGSLTGRRLGVVLEAKVCDGAGRGSENAECSNPR